MSAKDLRDDFVKAFDEDLDTAACFEDSVVLSNDEYLPEFVRPFRDKQKPGNNEYFAFLLGYLAAIRALEKNPTF